MSDRPHVRWPQPPNRWPLMWPSMIMEHAEIEKKWRDAVQPLIDACRKSTRLTAADYAVTINCRD